MTRFESVPLGLVGGERHYCVRFHVTNREGEEVVAVFVIDWLADDGSTLASHRIENLVGAYTTIVWGFATIPEEFMPRVNKSFLQWSSRRIW